MSVEVFHGIRKGGGATGAKGPHCGEPLFCGGCGHFKYEDVSGYGWCARDDEERHCFDLCEWQDAAISRHPAGKEVPGLK